MSRFLVFLSLIVSLVACGEIPRPYKTQSDAEKIANNLVIPADARGIYFHTSASKDDQDFARMLIEALGAYNIPVTQTNHLDIGYQLTGSLVRSPTQIKYVWDFFDTDLDNLKTKETTLPIEVPTSVDKTQTELAHKIALEIALQLKPDVMEALTKQQYLENISVKILQISGAPGDGNQALARNLTSILKKARIKISKDTEYADLVIIGTISTRKLDTTKELIKLDWLFQDHLGTELRAIRQQNIIPAGQLDGRWGDTAYIIAAGVVQDVALALDQLTLKRAN